MFEWRASQAETEKFMPKGPNKTTSPYLEASHTLLEKPMNFKNIGVKGVRDSVMPQDLKYVVDAKCMVPWGGSDSHAQMVSENVA